MLQGYLKSLYLRTMHEAYSLAHREILDSLRDGGNCLDCGAHNGVKYNLLKEKKAAKQVKKHAEGMSVPFIVKNP